MTASYAIVISARTKAIRRVIADAYGQIEHGGKAVHVRRPSGIGRHAVHDGEDILIVRTDRPHSPHDWSAQVHAQTGVMPPEPRAAVVDSKNIVAGVICAEAALDEAPQAYVLIDCDHSVRVGDVYNPRTKAFSS